MARAVSRWRAASGEDTEVARLSRELTKLKESADQLLGQNVRLLLLAFLVLLGLLIIQRIMWARIGERPDKKKRADDTQRPKGQQRRERRQATPPRAPWWEVLGVSQEASLEEINQHYRQAIRMYHPDKVAEMAPEIIALAERRTKELNAAFSQAKRVRSGAAK